MDGFNRRGFISYAGLGLPPSQLATVSAPGGARFSVASPYAGRFTPFLRDIEASGYAVKPGESGGYNPRFIAGTNIPSLHASGRAIDVNWADNARGTRGNIDPALARNLSFKHGLTWGGDWKNPDPMHFEVSPQGPRMVDQPAPPNAYNEDWLDPGGAIPGGTSSPEPSTSPATRVAGYQAAMPKPQAEQQGFLGLLSDSMMSPLFQTGAGVFAAASDGKNIGHGLMQGTQAAQKASAHQLQMMEARRKAAAQEQMRGLWGNLSTLGLPPQQTAALQAMGPEAGAPLLSQLITAQAQRELMNADPLRKAQVENIPLDRRMKEAQTKRAEAEANLKDSPDQMFRVREQEAQRIGLKPGSPGYQSYVLTGKMPREDQQPLSATDKKAILEADEMVMAAENTIRGLDKALNLSKKAYAGPAAGARGSVASGLAPWATPQADATVELGQVTTQQALESLKSTFGAAPTEGERKILLEIQGSVNQPQAVRESIYARASEAAQRRLQFHKQRSDELRGGTYYKSGGQPAAVNEPVGMTPGGGAPVKVRSPEEARKLPSGTPIELPDGTIGRVP